MTLGDETNDPGYQQKSNKICSEKLVYESPGGCPAPVSQTLGVKETCLCYISDRQGTTVDIAFEIVRVGRLIVYLNVMFNVIVCAGYVRFSSIPNLFHILFINTL